MCMTAGYKVQRIYYHMCLTSATTFFAVFACFFPVLGLIQRNFHRLSRIQEAEVCLGDRFPDHFSQRNGIRFHLWTIPVHMFFQRSFLDSVGLVIHQDHVSVFLKPAVDGSLKQNRLPASFFRKQFNGRDQNGERVFSPQTGGAVFDTELKLVGIIYGNIEIKETQNQCIIAIPSEKVIEFLGEEYK